MIVTIIAVIITKQSRHLFTRFGLLSFNIPLFVIFGFETMYFIDYLFYSCGKYFLLVNV